MIDPNYPDYHIQTTNKGAQLFWIVLFFNLGLSIIILIVLNDFWSDGNRYILYPLLLFLAVNIIGYYQLVSGQFLRKHFSKKHNLSGQV